MESLEPRILLAADLTGGFVQFVTPRDPAVPTDQGYAVVRVRNIGDQAIDQSEVAVYASRDFSLDASDFLLGTADTNRVGVKPVLPIFPDTSVKDVRVNLTLPSTLDPGGYMVLAKVDNANTITENSETNNVLGGGLIVVEWQFGNVPGRSGNTTLTLKDADGTTVTFSLSGPGLGEVVKDGTNWDLKVTGTTASSAVTILTNSAGNGRVTLNDVHVFGPIGTFLAATTDLTGTLAIDGPVNIPGLLPGTVTLRSIQGGTVAMPSVEALTIAGSVTNAKFFIGTTFGQDGQPGGTGANADTYGQGRIGLFTVTGAMSNTAVRVGVDPVDGTYGNSNDQLLGGTNSAIDGIVIGGTLSADTRFYAGKFPTQYFHGLTRKLTAGDEHFVTLVSGGPTALNAALQQDTGSSTSDGLTNNLTIVGALTDADGIATFTAGFGATPTFNVLSDRQPNGSFTFTRARLEQINGAPLTDGTYVLTLRATDTGGNPTQITVPFTLDTQIPDLSLDLDAASDTGTVGDNQTTNANVTLIGQTEANATVVLRDALLETLGTTTANASGQFSFSNVALTLGANAFTVRATDTAGNERTEGRTITRVAPANQAPVADTQTVTTAEDTAKAITLIGSDGDGDSLTYTIVDGPQHGTLTGTGATRTYTPDADYNGPDTFTFTVYDGTVDSNVATVTIDVTAVNDAPVLAPIGGRSIDEGQPLLIHA
ncbi:MAG: Ig-like domain-containing protein, partial [Gammaproteobacteria bacterium]|nr:Ig-like domain-containing protein [Gammaproteobacteria bacterium]